MENFLDYFIQLLAQFAGGPGPRENNLVRFGLPAVLWAILLGVAYMTLTQIVSALAPAYDISPILSTILPPALFSIAGVVALYRATPRVRRGTG